MQQELLLPHGVVLQELAGGGLSAARIWRCSSRHGPLALRAWPPQHPSAEHLQNIHLAMHVARSQGLHFIPQLYNTRQGGSSLAVAGQLWELTQWMPGAADYLTQPSLPRLQAAMQALAQLHQIWQSHATATALAQSPTVEQRQQRLQWAWKQLPNWTQKRWGTSPHDALVSSTLRHLAKQTPQLLRQLQQLAAVQVPVHFTLRDIWSDHVFFSGLSVTGIIDFGAARVDEPATDVARLLGSLEPLDAQRRAYGCDAYRELQPALDPQRVQVLDDVATLLAAVQWFQWLVLEQREFKVPAASLLPRWQQLLLRLETQAHRASF